MSDKPDWLYDWCRELTGFPNAAHDDMVTAVSLAAMMISTPHVVLPEFSPAAHVAGATIPIVEEAAVVVGWAFEPICAAVVAQEDAGQLRVLLCVTARPGTGVLDFGHSLADRLKREFEDAPNELIHVANPAHCGFSSTRTGHINAGQVLAVGDGRGAGLGWNLLPAEASRELRDEAIRQRLNRMERGRAALVLDPECLELIDALSGGYVYRVDEKGKMSPELEKNAAHALVEALGCVVTSLYALQPAAWGGEPEDDYAPKGTASGAGRRRR